MAAVRHSAARAASVAVRAMPLNAGAAAISIGVLPLIASGRSVSGTSSASWRSSVRAVGGGTSSVRCAGGWWAGVHEVAIARPATNINQRNTISASQPMAPGYRV